MRKSKIFLIIVNIVLVVLGENIGLGRALFLSYNNSLLCLNKELVRQACDPRHILLIVG
jgi:hypothetical protein